MAFAYGSGVFQQSGHADISKNMIDFIFVVDDPKKWHKENIAANWHHYSAMKYLGYNSVSSLQTNFGARVYFNTLVPCEGRTIKYGVISTRALKTDLLDWEFLYIGGRLQKPVYYVQKSKDSELNVALETNLRSAMHAALLMLPDRIREEELYETITGLSYNGDIRMTVGEDQNKIKNIVEASMENFRELYEPLFNAREHYHWNKTEGIIEQSLSTSSRIHHLNLLPKELTDELVTQGNIDLRHRDAEEVIRALSHDCHCRYLIRDSLAKIVKRSSFRQTVKGFLTAGLVKSVRYSFAKVLKMRRSSKSSKQSFPQS